MNDKHIFLRTNIQIPDIYFDNKHLEIDDESVCNYRIDINVIEKDLDTMKEKTIASLKGVYFDLAYAMDNSISTYDVFDMYSADTFAFYEILYEDDMIKEEYESMWPNVFYIERLYVGKEYRNKGYAKTLLNEINDIIRDILKLNVGQIIVYANPFEVNNGNDEMIKNNKVLSNKLLNLYKTTGFKEIDDDPSYLIKVCEKF